MGKSIYDKLLEYVKEMSGASYQEYPGGPKYKVNENYLDELDEIKEGLYKAKKQDELLNKIKEVIDRPRTYIAVILETSNRYYEIEKLIKGVRKQ